MLKELKTIFTNLWFEAFKKSILGKNDRYPMLKLRLIYSKNTLSGLNQGFKDNSLVPIN